MARGCLDDLRAVFRTRGEVFAYVALGHATWEVAIANLVSPGEAVLVPDTGMFARRWREAAEALGVEVVGLPAEWRRAIDPAAVEDALRRDTGRRIKAVFQVHVETSTGVAHDVAAVRRAIDRAGHPALLVVDAIASLAVMDLPMDEAGADVVLAASQKGLMLPPGMGFVAVGERARRAAERGGTPRRYWDWAGRRGDQAYMWFCGTPPVSMLFGLREALDMLLEEGLPAVFARHRRLAGAARCAVARWADAGALGFYALDPAARSDAVTAVLFAEGGDPDAVRLLCRDELGVAFGGGLGPLAGRVLRVGHLGDLNEPMLLGALGALEVAMRRRAVPLGEGGLAAAVASLAGGGDAGDRDGRLSRGLPDLPPADPGVVEPRPRHLSSLVSALARRTASAAAGSRAPAAARSRPTPACPARSRSRGSGG
jgi:alanine-glyoxylate transaminase/serine-glyoxylate transaminase/serine-pyruvate transaminase